MAVSNTSSFFLVVNSYYNTKLDPVPYTDEGLQLYTETFYKYLSFSQYGIYFDCSKKDFDHFFIEFLQQKGQHTTKYFAFIFLGHGSEGHLLMNDRQPVSIQSIIDAINTFVPEDVTKLFIINACRKYEQLKRPLELPETRNSIYIYSTLPGREAIPAWSKYFNDEMRTSADNLADICFSACAKMKKELKMINVEQSQYISNGLPAPKLLQSETSRLKIPDAISEHLLVYSHSMELCRGSSSQQCDIRLRKEYVDLCRTILRNYQKEGEPPLDELIAYCRYLLRCGRKSSDAVRAQVILKGVNTYRELEEVIMVMTKWLSFSFLERIVERFPTTSAESSLEEYKAKLKPVLEEKLTRLQRIGKKYPEESGTKEGFLKLLVKYNWDADRSTLEDVLESRRFLCSSLGIPDYLLQVLTVLLGSVIVEYLVLREFEREISEKVELLLRDDKMTAGFLRNGIVSLTIGGTVYNILKITNEQKFSAVKSCTLSSEWQRVIHSLYDVHDDDPLPAEYEYLMDKYRKAGQVMRPEEMRPEEMAYAEWFLLHKLPEVTRELRLDPWALLVSATSSYRTLSTLFPSHSDHIKSVKHSESTLYTLRDILRYEGNTDIKREIMDLDIAMESSEIESTLAAIREEFPLATLPISSIFSKLALSVEEEFFLTLFKALKGEEEFERFYILCSRTVPSYYKEDLDRAYQSVYQSVKGGDGRSDTSTGETQLATPIGQMPSSSASEGKVLKGSKEDVPSSDLAEVKRILAEFMLNYIKLPTQRRY